MQDDAAVRLEFLAVVGQGRVRVELEHSARHMQRALDGAVLSSLLRLAQVDEERTGFEFTRGVFHRQVLHARLGVANALHGAGLHTVVLLAWVR
jgi:hypothetical protein